MQNLTDNYNRQEHPNNLITPYQENFPLSNNPTAIACKLPLAGRKAMELSMSQETVTQTGRALQYCVEHRKEIIELVGGVAIGIGVGVAVSHIGKNNSKKKVR